MSKAATGKEGSDITGLLGGRQPLEWVVLDWQKTRVLGSGEDPVAALDAAGITIAENEDPDFVLMQVPDPANASIY